MSLLEDQQNPTSQVSSGLITYPDAATPVAIATTESAAQREADTQAAQAQIDLRTQEAQRQADAHSDAVANLKLSLSSAYAKDMPPDEAAKYERLSRATGFDPALISTDPAVKAHSERLLRLSEVNPDTLATLYPHTAALLSNPQTAALSHDDSSALQHLEDAWSNTWRSVGSGSLSLGAVALDIVAELGSAAGVLLTEQEAAVEYKNDPEGLKRFREQSIPGALDRMARRLQEYSSATIKQMPESAKQRYQTLEYATTDTSKSALLSPVRMIGDALQSLPSTAALMMTAYFTKKAAGSAASLASVKADELALTGAAKTEFVRQASVRAAERAATVSGAVGEGILGASVQTLQTAEQISKTDVSKSPVYLALLGQGYSPEAAALKVKADTADQAGIIAGLVDAGVNAAAGKWIAAMFTGKSLGKAIVQGVVVESGTEMVQSGGEQFGVNLAVKKSIDEAQSLTRGVLESMIQGGVIGGLTGGTVAGLATWVDGKVQAEGQANNAAEFHRSMTALSQAASSAKLRERGPEHFKQFMQNMAGSTDLKDVFIDATTLQELLAKATPEQQQVFAQEMPQVMAQITEAAGRDGAIAIPVEDYATHIAGKELDASILPHLKGEEAGLTYAQAQEQVKAQTEEMLLEEAKSVLADQKTTEEFQTDAQQVYDTLAARLEGAKRFSPDVNKKYAALQQAYFVTKAQRLGIKPSELLARFDVQVQAEPTSGVTLDQGRGAMQGLPQVVKVDGKDVTFGPHDVARSTAAAYMEKAGIPYSPPTTYSKVNQERAQRIAAAYEAMPHDPTNPEVKAAYDALISETVAQWQEIKATGLKVEFITGKDPYGNPRNAILDVVNNNHLWVFPTAEGFGGTESKVDITGNPLLQVVPGEEISGRPVVANDLFRIVHDYFGHVKEGVGFRADGEENAWRIHSAMFSPLAQRALTTETRGQNSWLNFGPYAEHNKTATGETTQYAPQKTGLLPEWVSSEGLADSQPESSNYGYRARDAARKATLESFAPEHIKDLLRTTDWAILTAENPNAEQLSPEENAARNAELKADLAGFEHTEVKGKYGGNEETSFIVTGITREQATALSQKYGQQSVLTRDGLVYPDGTVNPARGVASFDTAPADFYSQVPSTGAFFAVGIDLDRKLDLGEARPGEVTIEGVHFSHSQRSALEGSSYGKGAKGAETQRLSDPAADPRIKQRISFYVDEGKGVFPEAGVGAFRHETTLTNMYDAASNPLKLKGSGNDFEKAVVDAGFDGYYVKGGFGRQGVAVLLGDATRSVQVDLPVKVLAQAPVQTDTPAFKKWFGDSKVVDAEGKPLVVYHGTPQHDITEFKNGITVNVQSFGDAEGFYFTKYADDAASYGIASRHLERGGVVMPVYLSLQNPKIINSGDSGHPAYLPATLKASLIEDGYDGIIYNDGEEIVAFHSTQIKSAIGNRGTFDAANPNILYQTVVPKKVVEDAGFARWSEGGDVVEPEEVNDYQFTQGEPVVLKVYHGTTHKFSVFDAKRGNLEGQFGAINYFTSSYSDAEDNYAGEGPDLTGRIELNAERMEYDVQEKIDEEGLDAALEFYGTKGVDTAMEIAREVAKRELHGGEEQVMELFVKVKNPFVIGENAEWIEFIDNAEIDAQAVARVADDEGLTVEEIEASLDEYEDRIDEARWDIENETPDKMVEAIQTVADRYGADANNLASSVYDLGGRATPKKIEELLRASEDYAYAEHPDTGALLQSQMIAEVIEELGFDSIILRNAEERFRSMNIPYGTAHVHIFDSNKTNIKSVENIGTFDPTNPDIYAQKNRGTFSPDTLTISLLKDADLTTFLHETGHFFLETEAALAADPANTSDDFQKTLDWFGIPDLATWQQMSFEEKRPFHEQYARGFEAYLFEGKAPSAELRSIFASFKQWLLHVYRSLTNLNVELTDEVRGVFDRLLASDEAIFQTEQRNALTAALLQDMTPSEKAAYLALDGDASDDAMLELERRSMRDMQWLSNAKAKILKDIQKEAASKRKEVRDQVYAEVMAEPINQARTFLRKGEMTDPATGDLVKAEKGFRLNTTVLAEMYHETMLARPDLTKLRGMTSAEGLDPDMVATIFGFHSGDALVRTLIAEENPAEKIKGLTDQRMLEQYGELVDERAIEAAANEAVHNEARARFMATGLKALSKSELPAAQLVAAARDAAEQTISAKKVRDVKPAQYLAAETRANKEVLKNAAKDVEKAKRAQRSALLNNRLAKAASSALEEVRKGVDRLNRLQRVAAQDNMRGEYLVQLNALLDRFDLRTGQTLKAIDENRMPLTDWLAAESERLSAVMPDLPGWILNEGNKTHYKDLTMEEFRGVVDAVKQLELLARREEKQYQEIRGMKFAEERQALLQRIWSFHPEAFGPDGEPLGMSPKFVKHFGDTITELGDKFAGEFLNAETIVNLLEGGEFGLAHESLLGRMSKMADWKATRLGEIYKAMAPSFKQYSLLERRDFGRKDIGAPIGMSLTRENALVVALLHGNAEGRDRLSNYGWDENTQEAIIGLLDERDMVLAERIWSLFDNELWPELKALNDRTRGKSPPKVAAVPVMYKGKFYSGGYFRLKYDTNLDERAHRLDEGAAVKELLGGGLGMSAKTGQGASTERKQNVTMRPRLDLGVFSEAVSETVHDLAYREAVADTMRLLNDKGIQVAVKNAAGTPAYRALVTRVREIAAPPRNPVGFIEKTLTIARKNTIVTLMSGVNTALQNFTGFISTAARVHPGRLAKEIALFYSPKMTERYDFAMSQSEYMRNRHNSFERDLQNEIKKMTVNANIMPDTGAWLALMSAVDKGTSVPVWNTAFYDGMAKFENDRARATDYADHTVRQSQGSGRELDVAQIMAGHGGYGQLKRVFTMFYSYFNSQLGMLVRSGVVNKRLAASNPTMAAANFTKDFMLVFVLPALLTKAIFKGGEDKDPEEWLANYSRTLVMYGMAMFPLVRDIGAFAWASFDHSVANYGFKVTPIQSAGEGVVKGAVSARDILAGEGDDRDLKNLIMGASYSVGLPGKLISDTVLGTKAVVEGEAPPQAIVFGPPKK